MTISEKLSAIRERAEAAGRKNERGQSVSSMWEKFDSQADVAPLLEAVEAVQEEADKGRGPHAPYLTDYELGKFEALELIGSILEDHLGGGDDERS